MRQWRRPCGVGAPWWREELAVGSAILASGRLEKSGDGGEARLVTIYMSQKGGSLGQSVRYEALRGEFVPVAGRKCTDDGLTYLPPECETEKKNPPKTGHADG